MVIWHLNTLQNNHHDKSSYHHQSYYNIVDYIPYAVHYIPVTGFRTVSLHMEFYSTGLQRDVHLPEEVCTRSRYRALHTLYGTNPHLQCKITSRRHRSFWDSDSSAHVPGSTVWQTSSVNIFGLASGRYLQPAGSWGYKTTDYTFSSVTGRSIHCINK